jgi:hypothetical protein
LLTATSLRARIQDDFASCTYSRRLRFVHVFKTTSRPPSSGSRRRATTCPSPPCTYSRRLRFVHVFKTTSLRARIQEQKWDRGRRRDGEAGTARHRSSVELARTRNFLAMAGPASSSLEYVYQAKSSDQDPTTPRLHGFPAAPQTPASRRRRAKEGGAR